MTESMETIAWSAVMTDCGGKLATCSRKSMREATRSTKGTSKWKPP